MSSSSQAPTLDDALQAYCNAIHVMYLKGDASEAERNEANAFLTHFLTFDEAWQASLAVLGTRLRVHVRRFSLTRQFRS